MVEKIETQETTTADAPNSEGQKADTEQTTKTDNNEQTFTQEDVTRIAAREKREGKLSAEKSLLESLGIDSLDTVKALLDDAKKRKDAEMSELEKVQAANISKDERITAIEKELADTRVSHLQGQRDTHIKDHLLSKGAKPEDISNLLILVNQTMAEDKASLFSEDKPTPEASKLDAFTKQVQGNFSMYFGSAGAGSPGIDGKARNPSPAIAKEEAEKEIKRKFSSM